MSKIAVLKAVTAKSHRFRAQRALRPGRLPVALLGVALLGLAAPAWAATPATGHIVVSGNGVAHTYSCHNGYTVDVSGSDDRLKFTDTCSTLTVSGSEDFLKLNRLTGSVTLTSGTVHDDVCWDSGSPTIHNSGTQNTVDNCHAKAARSR
jgi:hypothetical protein